MNDGVGSRSTAHQVVFIFNVSNKKPRIDQLIINIYNLSLTMCIEHTKAMTTAKRVFNFLALM